VFVRRLVTSAPKFFATPRIFREHFDALLSERVGDRPFNPRRSREG